MSVGTVLSEARKQAQLTQAQLAELLQRPQSLISKIEADKRQVEVVEFLWIARCLGADVIELVAQLLHEGAVRKKDDRLRRNQLFSKWEPYRPEDETLDADEGTLGHWRVPK